MALVAPSFGFVAALDTVSGAERWRLRVPADGSPGNPTVRGGVVYLPVSFPSEGDTRAPLLYAVDAEPARRGGAARWHRARICSGPRPPSPTSS